MRIGIYGGSFNPPHIGHVNVAKAAVELLQLDQLYVIPAGDPYMKDVSDMADKYDRLEMCNLAFYGLDKTRVSSAEVRREGPTYTIDTVKTFDTENNEVFLIMGLDAFGQVFNWHKVSELVDLVSFAVFGRETYNNYKLAYSLAKDDLESELDKEIRSVYVLSSSVMTTRFQDPKESLSSTNIRKRIKGGHYYRHLIPEDVYNYIEQHNLYKEIKE